MTGPKFESDNREGIKFGKESGARLEFDSIDWTTKIPRGKKSFDRFSCRLSLPKRIPKVAPVNRILLIKFSADKDHSHDPIFSRGGANGAVWTI